MGHIILIKDEECEPKLIAEINTNVYTNLCTVNYILGDKLLARTEYHIKTKYTDVFKDVQNYFYGVENLTQN